MEVQDFLLFSEKFITHLLRNCQFSYHLFDQNIIWSNVICDLLIPQRTTLGGWAFYCWLYGAFISINTSQKKILFYEWIDSRFVAHDTHPFIFSLYSCRIDLVYFFLVKSDEKRKYVLDWMVLVLPAFLLSFPQLSYWTFPQSVSGGYLRLMPGWTE